MATNINGTGRVTLPLGKATGIVLGIAIKWARTTPVRGIGLLSQLRALTSTGRRTQSRSIGILTSKVALTGKSRNTLPVARPSAFGARPALAGISRVTRPRGVATGLIIALPIKPGRMTLARGKGSLVAAGTQALSGKGRVALPRASGTLRYLTSLSSKSRVTLARGSGRAQMAGTYTALSSIAKQPVARGRVTEIIIGVPIRQGRATLPRGIGSISTAARIALSGASRQTLARARIDITLRLTIAEGRMTGPRGIGQLIYGTQVQISGKGRGSLARGTGLLTTKVNISGKSRVTLPRTLGVSRVRTYLAGLGRHTLPRTVTTLRDAPITRVYSRLTQPRGKGLLSQALPIQGKGRTTLFRGRGRIFTLFVAGISRTAQPRAPRARLLTPLVLLPAPALPVGYTAVVAFTDDNAAIAVIESIDESAKAVAFTQSCSELI